MISNMTIYEGAFRNKETNIDNENIQQIIALRIFDTETPVTDTPYNVRYRITVNGDGTQTVTVTLDQLPDFIDSASFGYNDGLIWYDIEIEGTSATITIPEGDWIYSFLVSSELGDTRRLLTQGEIIDLEMGEVPLLFSVVDNDEDKFTPIKSKQVEIQIHSSDRVDASKFTEGGDNRYYVEVETQAEGIIFVGWLSISDIEQEFLPDPNVIILTATDGLGFLQDEPLVNFEGETPTGQYRLIYYLAFALARTGLKLDIKACMNIREETATTLAADTDGSGHFYRYMYLDTKTFEAEIGKLEDCLTVLEKILGENSFITQYKGKWVILRIDEIETGHEYNFTRFDHLGEFVENTVETFQKDIGVDYSMAFMNDDAIVTYERPYRSILEKFRYEYPEEIICNIDFDRGEVRVAPDLAAAESEGTYELDCWTKQKFPPTGTAIIPADNDAYIKRLFEFGYEKDRFIVLTPGPAAALEGIMSQPVNISEKDRIEISVDWRLASNVGSGDGEVAVKVFNILLLADNGDYYYVERLIDSHEPIWQGPMSGQNNTSVNYSWVAGDIDETEWTNISVTPPPAPVAGKLYVGLFKEWQGPGVYEVDTHYSNLKVEITPYLNGSYERYTGQEHSVSQNNDKIKAVRESEVFISDAPRVAMKGALLVANDEGNAVLTGLFYDGAKLPSGPSVQTQKMPYGQIQAFDVWNQFNRVFRKFEGTIDRTESSTQLPDILHKHVIRDINNNTTDGVQYRIFQLLHFEMDLHLCQWDCFLVEVFNTAVTKDYDGHSFRYTTK